MDGELGFFGGRNKVSDLGNKLVGNVSEKRLYGICIFFLFKGKGV